LHYNSFSILGRETFLAPVRWTHDGWPVIGSEGTITEIISAPSLPEGPEDTPVWRDDFDGPRLNPCWNFLRNPDPETWTLAARHGFLRLRGSARRLSDLASPAFVGRRQQHFCMEVSALIEFTPDSPGEEAGLTVLMNNEHHFDMLVGQRNGRRSVGLRRQVGEVVDESPPVEIRSDRVVLGVRCDGTRYHFWCEAPDRVAVGWGSARLLSPEVAHEGGAWSGMYLALTATGNGKPCTAVADVDWFQYQVVGEDGAA
jgi:alpha-N-arabinofuranosidase